MQVYHALTDRLLADFDHERVFDADIVGLSQTHELSNFSGKLVQLHADDYVYLYMPIDETLPEYVVAEGYIIANPYTLKPYRWCCKLTSKIEYFEDYQQRFAK